MTFIVTKRVAAETSASAGTPPRLSEVAYLADCSARAPVTRKLARDALETGAELRALGEAGADVAEPALALLNAPRTVLSGTLAWRAAGLDWALKCDFARSAHTIKATRCLLTVTPHEYS